MKITCRRTAAMTFAVRVTLDKTEIKIAKLKSRKPRGKVTCDEAFNESELAGLRYDAGTSDDSAPHTITLFPELCNFRGITGEEAAKKYVQDKIGAYLR
jgi:hypothetical protein